MSAKTDMLKVLDRRVDKHKKLLERREMTVENLVLEFFEEMENNSLILGGFDNKTSRWFIDQSHYRLSREIAYRYDRGAEVEVVFNETGAIQGILIKWSPEYIEKTGIAPEQFIGPDILLFKL